jgi:hypothetical protein
MLFVAALAAGFAFASPPGACRPHLYDDVRAAVTARVAPPHATYDTQLAFVTTLGSTKRTFRSRVFSRLGEVYVRAVTDEERADPPNPYGSKIAVLGMSLDGKKRRREQDHLGIPLLDPYYTFGMRRPQAVAASGAPGADSLAVIGRAATYDETYDVTCDEADDALHLRLVPRRDPEKNRLRDVIVDRTTLLPKSAVIVGNFAEARLRGTRWDIAFSVCDGALCVARESTDSPFTAPDGVRVTHMDVAFLGVSSQPEPRTSFDVRRSWRTERVVTEPE